MTFEELKLYLRSLADSAPKIPGTTFNAIFDSIERAKEFINNEKESIQRICEEFKNEKFIYVNLRIRPLSDERLQWLRQNESKILFWINWNVLQRFNIGWLLLHQAEKNTTYYVFDKNTIRFMLVKRGSVELSIAVVVAIVAFILLETFILGYEVAKKKPDIPPKPPIASTISSLTWLILVSFGIYVVVKTGVLENVKS